MTPAEYRALGQLMRWARAQGYTYHVTTAFGRTEWTWGKDGNYSVAAIPLSVGWSVHLDDNRVDLWPASVQQLVDVMVAVGLLPVEFRSGFVDQFEAVGYPDGRKPIWFRDSGGDLWREEPRPAAELVLVDDSVLVLRRTFLHANRDFGPLVPTTEAVSR